MTISLGRTGLLFLAVLAISFTSCDDDDDTVLGIDLDDDGTLFLSSNTQGRAGVLNLEDGDTPAIELFDASGTDADGIYYNPDRGNVFQVDRTNNVLVEYNDVRDDLDDPNGVDEVQRSSSDFTNGRGLAYASRQYVIAQQGMDSTDNRLVVYNTLNDNNLELTAAYDVDFPLWGVQFVGEALYAVVDQSDSVAVFEGFLGNTLGTIPTSLTPTRYIKVDGITRTHGLQYNSQDDVMILTDIGDANASLTDGALIVIDEFSTLGNVTTVDSTNYRRIAGAATRLGNPVDVDYDEDTDRIYVAERANGNGTLLVFDRNATGDTAPLRNLPFEGLSSLYLHRDR